MGWRGPTVSPSSLAPSRKLPPQTPVDGLPPPAPSPPPFSVCPLVLTGSASGTPYSPLASPASRCRVDAVRMRTPGSEGSEWQEGGLLGRGSAWRSSPRFLFSPEPPTASPSLRSKPTASLEAIPRRAAHLRLPDPGPWVSRRQGPGLLQPFSLACALPHRGWRPQLRQTVRALRPSSRLRPLGELWGQPLPALSRVGPADTPPLSWKGTDELSSVGSASLQEKAGTGLRGSQPTQPRLRRRGPAETAPLLVLTGRGRDPRLRAHALLLSCGRVHREGASGIEPRGSALQGPGLGSPRWTVRVRRPERPWGHQGEQGRGPGGGLGSSMLGCWLPCPCRTDPRTCARPRAGRTPVSST